MCIVTYDDTPCFLFLETVRTVSLLATLRYATLFLPHTVCYFPPVCLNVVFLFLPPSQAALLRSLSEKRGHRKVKSHSAGHSVVTGVWTTKKAGT